MIYLLTLVTNVNISTSRIDVGLTPPGTVLTNEPCKFHDRYPGAIGARNGYTTLLKLQTYYNANGLIV